MCLPRKTLINLENTCPKLVLCPKLVFTYIFTRFPKDQYALREIRY
mgnify:CR=1 FL=1